MIYITIGKAEYDDVRHHLLNISKENPSWEILLEEDEDRIED